MHERATADLAAAGLPRLIPVEVRVPSDIADLPEDVYVRSVRGRSPGRMAKSDLAKLLASGLNTYQVVPFVRSSLGATCIKTSSGVFIEFVRGHLSGLLRNGLLAGRVLVPIPGRGESSQLVTRVPQEQWVDPDSLRMTDMPEAAAHLDIGITITDHIAELALESDLAIGTLSEIVVSEAGPFWVDLKPFPYQVLLKRLVLGNPGLIYSSADQSRTETLRPKNWTPELAPSFAGGQSLYLGRHPLTSHYVTYCLDRGLSTLYC